MGLEEGKKMNRNNEEKLDDANKAAAKHNIEQIKTLREDEKAQEEPPKPKPKPIEKPKSIVDEPKSLVQQMGELNTLMKGITEMDAKKLKKKNFKMPFKVKSATKNLKKMMEKNQVQVLLLKITGAIQPTIGEINTGRLIVGEFYWNAALDSLVHQLYF